MKICYFNTSYYPYNIGGAETILKVLAENLSKLDEFEIFIITAFKHASNECINEVQVKRIKLNNPYWSSERGSNYFVRFHFHINTAYNLLNKRILFRLLKNLEPDLIHTHNIADFSPVIWSVAKQLGIPTIHTLHDYRLLCEKGQLFRREKICENRCLDCYMFSLPRRILSKYVDTVIGVSNFVLNKHIEFGFFKNSQKMVINNGINDLIKLEKKRRSINSLTFGYLGRISRYKGIFKLIEFFINNPNKNNSLIIAGSGNDFDILMLKEVIKNENRIHYLGYLSKEEFYKKIDFLFVPSLWYEPFPTVILEAFYYGIPVIANKIGGIIELIKNGWNGFLIDFNNYDEITKVMEELKIEGRKDTLVQNCLLDSRNYNIKKFLSEHIELYREYQWQ